MVKTHTCEHDQDSHDPFYGCLMPGCYCKGFPTRRWQPDPPVAPPTPRRAVRARLRAVGWHLRVFVVYALVVLAGLILAALAAVVLLALAFLVGLAFTLLRGE